MKNECIATLEELLKKKKKSEPSQENRNVFYNNWMKLTKIEGLKVSEKFLYEGFVFCGAEPLKKYISESEEPDKVLEEFFNGDMYGKDNSNTFRIVTHLLALFLKSGDKPEIIAKLIEKFPSLCQNKDKKPLGTAKKTVEKYFVKVLDDANLIPLENLKIEQSTIENFVKLMDGFISDINSPNVSKVKSFFDVLDECTINSISNLGDFGKNENIDVKDKKTEYVSEKPSIILSQVLKSVEEIENKNQQYEKSNINLQESLAAEREKLQNSLQKIDEAEKKLALLENEIKQKDEIINRQKVEISEHIQTEEILKNNQNFKSDEISQKIYLKLKVEYQDFQTALNVPMNEDLGENFRQQLKNIFKELERIGIKFS